MARNISQMEQIEATSSEEESQHSSNEAMAGAGRRAVIAGVSLFCLASACVAYMALSPIPSPSQNLRHSAAAEQPLTVRSLLESQELANLATDNIIMVGGETLKQEGHTREQVHAAVTRKLQNITGMLKERYPMDHQKLNTIQLSQVQKESVLGMLRHYSDARVVSLASDITHAVHENRVAGGDEAALKRRLTEKLQPRLGEIQKLGEELFPGEDVTMNFDNTKLKKWNAQVSMSKPQVSAARRLSGEKDFGSSVVVQAKAMFHKLEDMFGDEMPQAPGRMLTEGTQTEEEQSFISCMMEKMGDLDVTGCIGCVFSNLKEAFSMLMSVMAGGR